LLIFGRPATDYAFMACIWVAAVFYVVVAFGYAEDARAAPLFIGIPLVLLTTIDLISITNTPAGFLLRKINPTAAPRASDDLGDADGEPANSHGAVLGCLAAFVILFILFGAVVSVALYVASSMWLLGKYKLRTAAMTALIVAAFCYVSFELLLSIDLFKGIIPVPF
jgi:hypothetical protein